MTYILPEVQGDFARTELMLINVLLGIATRDLDIAAQILVDDNAALRGLAREVAKVLKDAPRDGTDDMVELLENHAGTSDPSVRISDLSATNDALRDTISRAAVALTGATESPHVELRARIIARLREELQRLPHNLLGPRADG